MSKQNLGTEVIKLLRQLPPGWSQAYKDGKGHWRIDGPNGEVIQWPATGRNSESGAWWLRKKLKKIGALR